MERITYLSFIGVPYGRMTERSPLPVKSATSGNTLIVSVILTTKKNCTNGRTLKKEFTTITNLYAHYVKRKPRRHLKPKQQRIEKYGTTQKRSENGRLIEPSMKDAKSEKGPRRRKSGGNGRKRRDWRCRTLLSRQEHRCLRPLRKSMFRRRRRVPLCLLGYRVRRRHTCRQGKFIGCRGLPRRYSFRLRT
jgi:hypothetical protein